MCRLDRMIYKLKNDIPLNEEECQAVQYELNCNIETANLPKKFAGQVIKRKDRHLILINSNLAEKKKKQAIIHELEHILNNDFNDDKNIIEKEKEN